MTVMPCMINRAYGDLTRPLKNLIVSQSSATHLNNTKVAIVQCYNYGAEVHEAMKKMLDLLGGIKQLVRNKTVTVKINTTTTNFNSYLGRPVEFENTRNLGYRKNILT